MSTGGASSPDSLQRQAWQSVELVIGLWHPPRRILARPRMPSQGRLGHIPDGLAYAFNPNICSLRSR